MTAWSKSSYPMYFRYFSTFIVWLYLVWDQLFDIFHVFFYMSVHMLPLPKAFVTILTIVWFHMFMNYFEMSEKIFLSVLYIFMSCFNLFFKFIFLVESIVTRIKWKWVTLLHAQFSYGSAKPLFLYNIYHRSHIYEIWYFHGLLLHVLLKLPYWQNLYGKNYNYKVWFFHGLILYVYPNCFFHWTFFGRNNNWNSSYFHGLFWYA